MKPQFFDEELFALQAKLTLLKQAVKVVDEYTEHYKRPEYLWSAWNEIKQYLQEQSGIQFESNL